MQKMVWFKEPMKLVDSENIRNLLPTDNMSNAEQHNSFMRFVLIFSICVFLINKNYKIAFIPIFCGILSCILYKIQKNETVEQFKKTEQINDYKCTKPKPNNPFMNVLLSDYENAPNKFKACDVTSDNVKKKMVKLTLIDIY